MESTPDHNAEFQIARDTAERGLHLAAFEAPEIEIYAIDSNTLRVISANRNGIAAHRTSVREIVTMSASDLLGGIPDSRVTRLLDWPKRRRSNTASFQRQFMMPDGSVRLKRVILRFLPGPKPSHMIFVQDVGKYQSAQREAKAATAMLKTVVESLPDGFVLFDQNERLVVCNTLFKAIHDPDGNTPLTGLSFDELLTHGVQNKRFANAIGHEETWLAKRRASFLAAEGQDEEVISDDMTVQIVERKTADEGRIGLWLDVTDRKKQQAQLRESARTDYLTGALNRRGMTEELSSVLEALKPGQRIAVLHIDLDKFKSINDALGHEAGDFALRHCARVLGQVDWDGKRVVRAGGDEFILFGATLWDDAKILAVAERISRNLARPIRYRDGLCNVGVSTGIAFYHPDEAKGVQDSFTAADIALNRAKHAGRGLCMLFEDSMRDDAVRLIDLAQQIRIGLQEGQFEPFFQPQIDAKTGRIAGFEALIRWRHPERGLVPAFEFLSAAERAGQMDQLDHVVMDRSCFAASQLKSWGMRDMSISINMSMGQLQDPRILARLMRYVDAYGIEPADLRVELLESTLLDDRSTVIIDNVHQFISHGFAVELDDFGTGHAAIATLRKFDVSRIKIDRSLVQNIDTDHELQVITGAIVDLAVSLGISPLAEGVETDAEQAKLKQLGCSYAQGYLHARPMPLVQLRAWITAHFSRHPAAASAQMPESA